MELIWELAAALALAAVLRGLVFTLARVEGASMRDTLRTGDVLLATRLDALVGAPAPGSVVLCRFPGTRKCFVKRVIGLPGDTVEVLGGVTRINGVPLSEPYVRHPALRDFGPVTLGVDEYFVMGDNRARSRDSRAVGPLSRRQITAIVRLRLWPPRRVGRIPARCAPRADGESARGRR